jgi:2-polyprenyl-3-methyl-5-hydroxy-6-metoxy-1,4-benzoquinol methylase
VSFKHRSYQAELLDRQDIPFADIQRNMQELDFINKHLGGHQITLKGLREVLRKPHPLHIAEIGCGGGNNLRVIKQWCSKKGIDVQLTGIDINNECIVFAKEQLANKDIRFICSDYRQVYFDEGPDIIFSSLFCHHFTDEELVFMMQWMYGNCRIGFFINDLHRHPLAYYSIKLLTRLFSKSYLVKNDAPLSVKRGLTKTEWEEIFRKAGITTFEIKWKWAFRWLIICHK